MKYTKISVKCSQSLIDEIDEFLNSDTDHSFILRDFLTEIKEGITEELARGHMQNEYPEIKVTLPAALQTLVVPFKKRSHSELQLLFKNILAQQKRAFRR